MNRKDERPLMSSYDAYKKRKDGGAESAAPAEATAPNVRPLRLGAPLRRSGIGALSPYKPDAKQLAQARLIAAARHDPAYTVFDVLRTSLLSGLEARGWSQVAVTSATKGCGKSLVAANLAISLSRQDMGPTLLMDLDLRRPAQAPLWGVTAPLPLVPMLIGDVSPCDVLQRMAPNEMGIGEDLILGFNGRKEINASEVLRSTPTGVTLAEIQRVYRPAVTIYDMPPVLYHDDVLAFRSHLDAVLIVVGGGVSRPRDLHQLKKRLGDSVPILGVVLNRAEGLTVADYSY